METRALSIHGGLCILLCAAGCGDVARLTVLEGSGTTPTIPLPVRGVLPTLNIAPATGWAPGAAPTPAPGLGVTAYATGLEHPRWLYTLPNGDVLVAETNAPASHDSGAGLRGWVMKLAMKRAGAAAPSPNRIVLLRDTRHTGAADMRSVFLDGLNSPFGMTLVGDSLYVADTDALLRFRYHRGDTRITAQGERVVALPAGPINHHWTKNVVARADGTRLYVTVGSNSNVAENGMAAETGRAAVWEVDPATGAARIYASGLRNPNGLAWEPHGGALWTTVNERDELGSDLVPDYMTALRDGGFYGWPYAYYGGHADPRVRPQRPDRVAQALVPDYALGPHTASLGLAFYEGSQLPAHYVGGAFIGQHGSWNRRPASGYRVVFVPFRDGLPAGPPEPVLTGFLGPDGEARGRPVGVVVAGDGALLVADDVGNTIWRISSAREPLVAEGTPVH